MPLGRCRDYGDARYAGVEIDTLDLARDLTVRTSHGALWLRRLCCLALPTPRLTTRGRPCARASQAALDGGFDFVIAPLSLPRDDNPAAQASHVPRPPVVSADFVLASSTWTSQVVGHVSRWIDPDAEDHALRARSEQTLRTELGWAAHMSFQVRP